MTKGFWVGHERDLTHHTNGVAPVVEGFLGALALLGFEELKSFGTFRVEPRSAFRGGWSWFRGRHGTNPRRARSLLGGQDLSDIAPQIGAHEMLFHLRVYSFDSHVKIDCAPSTRIRLSPF